jgi:branched-chain amino acid transport system substrate-binding protein
VARARIGALALTAVAAATVAGARGGVSALQVLPQSFCSPLVTGGSQPDVLIASDLPVRYFDNRPRTLELQGAIRYELQKRHFKAGRFSIGYQACDDSSPQEASGALPKCAANAKVYAQDKSVVGVVGTWSSHCAAIELPTLNRAPSGPLGLISSTNTNVGLTHAGGGTNPGEPGRYYPTGKRSFVRIISADDAQAVADAWLAKQIGAKAVFVLDDSEGYGLGVAFAFRRTAAKIGLKVVGTGEWTPDQSNFDSLTAQVGSAKPDAVFLGGFACPGCGALIKGLRAVLPAQATIIGPDGFTPPEDLVKAAGAAAEGMYVSFPGLPAGKLPAAGERINKRFGGLSLGSGGPAYAAQAVAVLLDAIAASDGTRASVNAHLLSAHVRNGIIGSFSFDRNGDTTYNPTMIFRVSGGKGVLDRVVTPPPSLIP